MRKEVKNKVAQNGKKNLFKGKNRENKEKEKDRVMFLEE